MSTLNAHDPPPSSLHAGDPIPVPLAEQLPPSKEDLERKKTDLEGKKIEKELKPYWRFLQTIGPIAQGATVIIAILSFLQIYHQGQETSFRVLLQELGGEKPHTRLGAISRLEAYDMDDPPVGMAWLFGGPSPADRRTQVAHAITAAIRLEENLHIKAEMRRLLVRLGKVALRPLQQARIDLISLLKEEHPGKSREHWDNHRETLFQIAISISEIERNPPDFRCFPFKGIKLRLRDLKGANFSGTTLAEAEIWGGSLRGAKFTHANLYKAIIRDLDVAGASFQGAELRGAHFGPNLSNVDPKAFRNSNWGAAKSFDPTELKQQIEKALSPDRGAEKRGPDRDTFCSQLLNREFLVKQ